MNANSLENREENHVQKHKMKSRVGIASIESNRLPHTNPFWPDKMRENGEFVQVAVKGAMTQLVRKVVEKLFVAVLCFLKSVFF